MATINTVRKAFIARAFDAQEEEKNKMKQ